RFFLGFEARFFLGFEARFFLGFEARFFLGFEARFFLGLRLRVGLGGVPCGLLGQVDDRAVGFDQPEAGAPFARPSIRIAAQAGAVCAPVPEPTGFLVTA
ncbi:MAG: hypothetical protein V2J14_08830, partial [Erythrobacter sp.]|nr:hypothetical protein [Erythrobacter sp.]